MGDGGKLIAPVIVAVPETRAMAVLGGRSFGCLRALAGPGRGHPRRTGLLAEVRRVDPEWDREGKRPVVYRMSNGREFREVEGSSYTEGESPATGE